MLEEFPNYIPKVVYLENKKLNEDIKFPLISKPIYSTNGKDMFIIKNQNELKKLTNKKIIQEFVDLEYEYGAFFLCINGKIINIKIIKKLYPKYHIKKSNFINFIEVNNFPIEIFEEITLKINYSGGGNIDFKYDEDKKKIYIFEFNARFGGSAFSKNFIYDLLCIK